jgi:uncharacterized protein YecA (UPF0149 family)
VDLYPKEFYDTIKKAFDKELVDEAVIDLASVDQEMAAGEEAALAKLRSNGHLQLVEGTIEEMEWWAWFQEPVKEKRMAAAAPVKAPPKIGRNDPCPCGSGRKYKKCCGS